jgi:hypothetical protein
LRDRVRSLSPIAFENLVFDLARAGSLKNLVWRTPGTDGGRDIEGEAAEADFSGQVRLTRWLIECKRYSNSIGWPVVWEKVAYADSATADFLLIVATTTFTPKCLDEISKWNARGRQPIIRVWPINEVVFRVSLNPALANKYNISDTPSAPASALSNLALHTAKMSQAASASLAIGKPSEKHLEAATALAELMLVRSTDMEQEGRFVPAQFLRAHKWPHYVRVEGEPDLRLFDSVGLSAFLASLNVLAPGGLTMRAVSDDHLCVRCTIDPPAGAVETDLLRAVAFWSSLTARMEGEEICLTAQTLA